MAVARHEMGERNYGYLTFLNNDTIMMAMEEVVDLANYARYTFTRLYMLKKAWDLEFASGHQEGPPSIGKTAFTPIHPKEDR